MKESLRPRGSTRRSSTRACRLLVLLLALLLYLMIDAGMLARPSTDPHWGLQVSARGEITWVDPNGRADAAGVRVGDRLLRVPQGDHSAFADLAHRPALLIGRQGRRRWVRAAAPFAPTGQGQTLVIVGSLVLVMGGLAWAYGRRGRAPAMLAGLSVVMALALLGLVWGRDGHGWALRLAFLAGSILFPLCWAAFFLTFPANRLARLWWRLPYIALCILALVTALTYALSLLAGLPYAIIHLVSAPVFLCGPLLGIAALLRSDRGEMVRKRQQRRLMALSAAAAVAPLLVGSFLPFLVLGHVLLPYEVSAQALIALPLGLAYAIVRYDLMELDVVVRRAVAFVLTGVILVTAAALVSLALRPFVPQLNLLPVVIAVLAGAMGGRLVQPRAQILAERLLSPELLRSRHLVASLDPLLLNGDADVAILAARLEAAACAIAGTSWAHLMVRRRAPDGLFSAPREGASPLGLPHLAALLTRRPWGIAPIEARHTAVLADIAALDGVLGRSAAVVVPLRVRGEVIAVLAIGERSGEEPLQGPDREALALLATHFALALDHARVRAEVDAERADATAFSQASAELTASLADRQGLPERIVESVARLRDVRGVAILLYEPGSEVTVAAARGQAIPAGRHDVPATVASPAPHAWLPLIVGGTSIGALGVRWSGEHIVHEHEHRLLAAYANGVAMALEHARLYERARIQAEHDPVTDLFNHRAFHARLESALEQARATDRQVGLLLIDLTDFKLFNDTHGHQAGDQALRRVGEVLQSCGRDVDVAARLGGDEFAVLLPDADLSATRTVAERIIDLAAISALISPDGLQVPVRLSIGAAAFPDDARAANALLAKADERMYEAKRTGINLSIAGREAVRDDESGPGAARFGILEALVAMVDNRDRYTADHSDQVATYAASLGEELGLSHDTIATLRLAGLLHDVGKIGVPDRILRKPGRLSDEEFEVVRRHVELSEALLTVVSQERDLLDAVRYHHERWDGAGYPRGTLGEEIPLLGRIMIIADAVSAMGMDRPYRKGMAWDSIALELHSGAGSQFDPALVPIALRSLRVHVERTRAA